MRNEVILRLLVRAESIRANWEIKFGENVMSDDGFNMSLRKFLKTVGVTSQHEIEEAVRAAGAATPNGTVEARMVLSIDALGLKHEVVGRIEMPGDE